MTSFSVFSGSAVQTKGWGRKLGRLLHGGEIIGLSGELGSGKTCFVRGMAEGLDVEQEAWIRSPTFTLINEYHGRLPVYHIDLYRVSAGSEMEELNLREYLYSEGVSAVEWFEHFPSGEIEEYLHIGFAHAGANTRKLTFTAYGSLYEELVEGLRAKELKGSKVQTKRRKGN